jgi:hypothetical protein
MGSVGRMSEIAQKGVGIFSGIRNFLFNSVRHRLQRAPEEDSANAGLFAHFQAWGARGRVFESLRPDHIFQ